MRKNEDSWNLLLMCMPLFVMKETLIYKILSIIQLHHELFYSMNTGLQNRIEYLKTKENCLCISQEN